MVRSCSRESSGSQRIFSAFDKESQPAQLLGSIEARQLRLGRFGVCGALVGRREEVGGSVDILLLLES